MAASSARIDELRKKFDENPRRYFAPLANEYRKAGDLEQAIFICQEYLPQQPGHMSGHIVYGQALYELGRHDEARTVFETALSLDPENLIALRHLGDIARQGGDTDAARGWYQRVLEADPRNEEIAQIMMTLITSDVPVSSPPPVPDVEAGPTTATAETSPAPPVAGAPIPVDRPAVPASPTSDTPVLDTSVVDTTFGVEKSVDTVIEVPPPPPFPPPLPPPLPVQQEAQSPQASREHELLDLDADAFGIGASAAVPSTGAPSAEPMASEPPTELATDLELGLPDDGMASTTPAGGDLPLDGLETFESGVMASASEVAAPALETESFFDTPPAPEPPPVPEAAATDAPAPETLATPPEPQQVFVTETMAELYLQQGHLEAALDIYRRLVELRPDERSLQDKLDEIERRVFGTASPSSSEPTPASAPAVATATSYGGPTIRDFLMGLITGGAAAAAPDAIDWAAEPIATPADAPPAELQVETAFEMPIETPGSAPEAPSAEMRPTPSATHTVSESLDVFFGGADAAEQDDQAAATLAEAFASEGPDTAPLQGLPAHRADKELSLDHVFKSGGTPRASGEHDNFSFDQFFSAESPATNAPSAEDAASTPPEETDDVAQFNAWLNGLKKT